MSHDAHVAAVDHAINELSSLGAALQANLEQAKEALGAVNNATGDSGNDAASSARSTVQQLADDQNGSIVGCMGQVAHAIEKLSAYRASWAGSGG